MKARYFSLEKKNVSLAEDVPTETGVRRIVHFSAGNFPTQRAARRWIKRISPFTSLGCMVVALALASIGGCSGTIGNSTNPYDALDAGINDDAKVVIAATAAAQTAVALGLPVQADVTDVYTAENDICIGLPLAVTAAGLLGTPAPTATEPNPVTLAQVQKDEQTLTADVAALKPYSTAALMAKVKAYAAKLAGIKATAKKN